MKTIVLKDYYYEDRLILEEEWGEYYEGILTDKINNFDEMLDIFNRCNSHPFPITRDNTFFKNLSVTDEKLDEIAQRETRFGVIKTAVIWGWLEKEIVSGNFGVTEIDNDHILDIGATFNGVINNIHYGRIKQACFAKLYPYETKDVYKIYSVPQILIDEFKNHKRIK